MRRIAALAPAAVVSLPIVSPVAAADPLATAEPSAPAEPTPSSEPIAPPEPTPAAEPTPAPEPTPGRSATRHRPPTRHRLRSRAGRRPVRIGSAEGHGQERTRDPRRREGPADRDRSIHRRPRGISGHDQGPHPTSATGRHQGGPLLQARIPRLHGRWTPLNAEPSSPTRASRPSCPTRSSRSPPRRPRPVSSRVGTLQSSLANVNGVDDRVDADVAIVDTGIASHPDLVVAGGYNCSSTDRTRWYDEHGHGTHVAGTVGARDNTIGVGRRPGRQAVGGADPQLERQRAVVVVRLRARWILAQRDPEDSSRPLIEAVNMSVAKSGSDDANCGFTNRTSSTRPSAGSTGAASRSSPQQPTSGGARPATSRRPTTRSSRSRPWPIRTAEPAAWAATAVTRGAATTATTRSPTSATTDRTST